MMTIEELADAYESAFCSRLPGKGRFAEWLKTNGVTANIMQECLDKLALEPRFNGRSKPNFNDVRNAYHMADGRRSAAMTPREGCDYCAGYGYAEMIEAGTDAGVCKPVYRAADGQGGAQPGSMYIKDADGSHHSLPQPRMYVMLIPCMCSLGRRINGKRFGWSDDNLAFMFQTFSFAVGKAECALDEFRDLSSDDDKPLAELVATHIGG